MAQKFDNRAVVSTPSYSTFDLSYRSRLTGIMGDLIPVLCKEIVPGDHFKVGVSSLIRLAPLQAPVFDDCRVDFHAFFVQNRIIDPRWKEFITGGIGLGSDWRPADITPLLFSEKYLVGGLIDSAEEEYTHQFGSVSSLADYLGIHYGSYTETADQRPSPTLDMSGVDGYPILAYPFLAYHQIWNDWFRNERIEEALNFFDDAGNFLDALGGNGRVSYPHYVVTQQVLDFFAIHKRNFAKDKYTTALPEPVIGGPVTVPSVSGTVPLEVGSGNAAGRSDVVVDGGSSSGSFSTKTSDGITTNTGESLFVDLSNAAMATIQQLKTAFKMYSFFMKDTYNGNRYVEFIESHFNRRVPDATLDRALYLGKTSANISFGEVFQTSEGDGTEGSGRLGNYAGRGVGAAKGFLFNEQFDEHGYIIVIMSIVPRATYFQGIDKKFLKKDRFDFFFPEFQDIGDDKVIVKELYNYPGANTDKDDENVFGYQSRWHEYKQYNNELHGDFLTNMRFWTLSRKFDSEPKLGPTFSNIPVINNPFIQIDEFSDNYLIDLIFHITASRPMKFYETF